MSDLGCNGTEVVPVLKAPRRNRYFYGKLLDAPHLELEQRYGMDKRGLLNRLTLGFGVVCGLDVVPTVDGARVRVMPGVAVDGWGREVVVPAESPPLDVRQLLDACGRPEGGPLAPGTKVVLWLAYHECAAEPVPVLVGDCDTERGCANSIVREQYALVLQADEELAPAPSCGFPGLGAGATAHPLLVERTLGACPGPAARPWVPLARIVVPDENAAVEAGAIDRAVRPVVATNQLLLELVLCLADRVEQCCGGATPELELELVSGDAQTGEAGRELSEPVVVRVVDDQGQPAPGHPIDLAVTAGGGSVQPASAPSDANGLVSGRWTLGSGADAAQELRASLASGARVLFSARAEGAVVEKRITRVSGDGQAGPAGGELAEPLVVLVDDQNGDPVAGELVDFEASPSGASLNPVQAFTDSSGRASTRWTLAPTPGAHELVASIQSGSVNFAATAEEAPAQTLPILLAVWPPNAAVLESDDRWMVEWRERPRLELTFDREMREDGLASADRWLRAWNLSFDGEGAVPSRMRLEFAGRVDNPLIGDPAAFTVAYVFDSEQTAATEMPFLILMRPAGDRIVDTSDPPLPLDVDFRGTRLDPDVMKEIWATDGTFVDAQIRSSLVDTGATLPANDGQPGREYDSWFSMGGFQ